MIPELVAKINSTPTRAVIISTGGGTDIFPMLLRRGGGSATLLSGMIPYSESETHELLGGKPTKLVSEQTTRMLAMSAFQRALELGASGDVVGIAANAVLQKTPEERDGRLHQIFVALQSRTKTVSLSLTMDQSCSFVRGLTDAITIRELEESITARMILNLLAEGCGLKDKLDLGQVTDLISRIESPPVMAALQKLMTEELDAVGFDVFPEGNVLHDRCAMAHSGLIFPGSFNPYHDGHREMAQASKVLVGKEVEYEISFRNVSKPNLDYVSLLDRLRQLALLAPTERSGIRVWVTNAPTFVGKTKLFQKAKFVVGYDTANRIVDARYAGPLEAVVAEFKANQAEFLVFGRTIEGTYLSDLSSFPESFRSLAQAASKRLEFASASSTKIRETQA